jgi:hypothetical protein
MDEKEKSEIARQWKFYHLTQKLITGRFTCDEPFMLNTVVTAKDGTRLRLTPEELAEVYGKKSFLERYVNGPPTEPLNPKIEKKILDMEAAIIHGYHMRKPVLERLPSEEEDDYEMEWEPYMDERMWTLAEVAKEDRERQARLAERQRA